MICIRNSFRSSLCLYLLLVFMLTAAQSANAQDDTFTGTVVSSSRYTLVVRSADGRQQLFTFAQGIRRPQAIPVGSQVRVISSTTDETNVRSAREITLLPPDSGATTTTQAPVVPEDVRRIERDIERTARRYQLGVRAGVGLDPELVLFGIHAQVGPFFDRDIYFRPNAEFAIGEVTALIALNPEVIYRLPVSSREGRWSTYLGVGPGFNFIHQNFGIETGGDRIDFGEFRWDAGLNILGGIRYRSGMFMELKTSIYTAPSPTFRFIIGYNF